MSKDARTVKMARPGEPDAVRTTIVGGRPPGGGVIPRHIPRGLEVIVKKAAVDPAFKKLLFDKRAEAAKAIGLKLTAAEEAILAAVPLPHLEGIIAHTRISPKLKPAFLGYAAGVMLAALGVATAACDGPTSPPATLGSQPDPPPKHPGYWPTDESGPKQRVDADKPPPGAAFQKGKLSDD